MNTSTANANVIQVGRVKNARYDMMNVKSPIVMVMGTASVANVNVSVDIKVPRAKKVKCSISILIMPFWHPKFMAMFLSGSLRMCTMCKGNGNERSLQ